MSFETLFSALSPLTDSGVSQLDKYSEKDAYVMSTMSTIHEYKILHKYTEQPYLKNPEYSVFQMDIQSNQLVFISDFLPIKNQKHYPINFQINNKSSIVINALSILTLGNYLSNCKNRYIYLPIDYTCDTKASGHRAILMYDIKLQKVYLLEPNGKPSFFNNVIGNIEMEIELFFEKYTEQLNELFCMNYKYIKTNIWNINNIVLNNTSNTKLSKGDCLSISLLMCHLITNLEYDPYQLYKSIKGLSDDEFVTIIRSYSMGIINYLKKSKDNKNIIFVEKLFYAYQEMKSGMPQIQSVHDFHKYLYDLQKNDKELYKSLSTIYNLVY